MRYLWLAVTSLGAVSHVAVAAGNNSTIAEVFPQLNNLQQYPASRYSLSVGAQDMDHCCLLAVNNSLSVINGTLIQLDSGQSPIFLSSSPLFWFLDGVTAYNNTIITTNYKYLAASTSLSLVINR